VLQLHENFQFSGNFENLNDVATLELIFSIRKKMHTNFIEEMVYIGYGYSKKQQAMMCMCCLC
jgi:hypothetical protein